MKRLVPLLVALIMSASTMAQSMQSNPTFLGVSKDSTRAEITEKFECKFEAGKDFCFGSYYIPVSETRNDRIEVLVTFLDEKLQSCSFETDGNSGFAKYTLMLIEKYGNPIVKKSEVQNRMGGRFEKIEMKWSLKGATIQAANISRNIDTGRITFTISDVEAARATRERSIRKNIF